jgi:hypothetical protein
VPFVFKSKTDVDNKRHTNARQPFASDSTLRRAVGPAKETNYALERPKGIKCRAVVWLLGAKTEIPTKCPGFTYAGNPSLGLCPVLTLHTR